MKEGESGYKIMHSLLQSYVKVIHCEQSQTKGGVQILYPVKLVLPPNKSRVLYFSDAEEQLQWAETL